MCSTRRGRKLSSQPLRSRSSSTCARNSPTRRVVAVEDRVRRAAASARRRDARRTARPGNDVARAVAVALGAHLAAGGSPPPGRARPRPGRRRVPKTAISSGASPPCRRVWYAVNAGEPAADDRRRGPLTSPSPRAAPGRSSAGTRRTRSAGSTSEMNDAGRDHVDVRAELAQLAEDPDGDRLRVPPKVSATIRSFHVQRNWKIASDAIAGSPSGRISRKKIRISLTRRRSAPTRGCPSGSR